MVEVVVVFESCSEIAACLESSGHGSMTEQGRRDWLHLLSSVAAMTVAFTAAVATSVLYLGFWDLAATHLLGLEVLIQQVESLLVGALSAGDGEHALASIIMWRFGDRNARA